MPRRIALSVLRWRMSRTHNHTSLIVIMVTLGLMRSCGSSCARCSRADILSQQPSNLRCKRRAQSWSWNGPLILCPAWHLLTTTLLILSSYRPWSARCGYLCVASSHCTTQVIYDDDRSILKDRRRQRSRRRQDSCKLDMLTLSKQTFASDEFPAKRRQADFRSVESKFEPLITNL